MVISGTVSSIIFHNSDSGYTVLEFETDDNASLTAVGFFPDVLEGEPLKLTGTIKKNPKYGDQFDVTECEFVSPKGLMGIISYLSSGLFKGIGEIKAISIAKLFGEKTFDVIENDPFKLIEVPGISPSQAQKLSDVYKARKHMQNTIIFLLKHGCSMQLALKIYQEYGDNTERIITKNPYRIVDDIDGVGFFTADKMAVSIGIDVESDFRKQAAISHVLRENSIKNGHTFMPEEKLVKETERFLKCEEGDGIGGCLSAMEIKFKIRRHIFKEDDEDKIGYALTYNYNTEESIAARLFNLTKQAKDLDIDVENEINVFEKQNSIVLHTAQKDAVRLAIKKGVLIITGGPGTGKTTIIKCILQILQNRRLGVSLCAPTGRAAKRLSEAADTEATTIHRLLGANKNLSYYKNEDNPLDADVVIVDEISMADIYIFNALLKAMRRGSRLIIVGDKDQLPSVSAGNILADIIASKFIPIIYLTEIYRQEGDSLIVVNAHRINSGQMPIINNKSTDFFYDKKESPDDIVDAVKSMIGERITNYFKIPVKDIQVLAPMKKTTAGVENLNITLQSLLNPENRSVTVGNTTFKVGDKVMHTVNNYMLKWVRNIGYEESGEGVFNGDIGYIRDIKDQNIIVEFDDGRIAAYTNKKVQEELVLAYAVSIHKSQGCEFEAVIIVVPKTAGIMLTRNLLYTALTRAKNLAIIIGSEASVQKMVSNNYTAKRYTLLKDFICKIEEKSIVPLKD